LEGIFILPTDPVNPGYPDQPVSVLSFLQILLILAILIKNNISTPDFSMYIYRSMNAEYDVVVVGAGPAGLNASLHLLQNKDKPSVLLLDKITPWENPIACAEGVWYGQFKDAVKVRSEWIRNFISKAVLHSPDGTEITYTEKDKGCIINRARMQRDLAQECVGLGATVRLNCRVADIRPEKDAMREVLLSDGSIVRGRVVIDASGPVSTFGRNDKISWKPKDLEPAYFAVVENSGIEMDAIHVYLGANIAPGGYAWAFPRERGAANVGIVVGRAFLGKVNIRKLLALFLAKDFPHAQPVRYFAGSIPCEAGMAVISCPGFFKAGDAASSINPISRAGIMEALVSGGLAGDWAAKMLSAKSRKQASAVCRKFHDVWHQKMGKSHGKLARVKGSLLKVPDNDYNQAFRVLKNIPRNKLMMSKIVTLSLGRYPRLVWSIRHLM
jgi:digeranylgeranylglycerophospholipid reductase